MSVTLGLVPEQALVNDVNPHLINLYCWLKRGLSISIPMQNDETMYCVHREQFNELVSSGAQESKEAAELFYYLNRAGYNGLCRFNQQGQVQRSIRPTRQHLVHRKVSRLPKTFHSWTFTRQDFEALALAADDFVYADPPYDVDFTQYAKGGLAGTTRPEQLSGSRSTLVQSFFQIKPRTAFWRSMEDWASSSHS